MAEIIPFCLCWAHAGCPRPRPRSPALPLPLTAGLGQQVGCSLWVGGGSVWLG